MNDPATDLKPRLSKVEIAALVGAHGNGGRATRRDDIVPPQSGGDEPGRLASARSDMPATPDMSGAPGILAGDENARVRVGAARETLPGILAALSVDPAVMVRVAVAMNRAAPIEADTRLARDSDTRVRSLLARKVAALIPDLPPADRATLQDHALAVLQTLVADEAVRVREAIADVVKEMPQAPRDLILRLARDGAFSVSEPVIRLSPLLSSEDLLAILAARPTQDAPMAVARRHGLNETVSDAIATGTDPAVITALLANPSARIREATLDSLIARAPTHIPWHEPLVNRPILSSPAVRALSQIVATHLLKTLAERMDLGRETTAELRLRLAERLQSQQAVHQIEPSHEEAMTEARGLNKADLLNERKLLETAMRGDARRAAAMLAVAAGVELPVVERAAQLRNAKALVSLVWRAGYTMRLAGALQVLLAGLGPDAALRATFNGGFPLGIDEMRWQLDCLSRGAR
jgi:uncharacterized protein (DUF2336 family)